MNDTEVSHFRRNYLIIGAMLILIAIGLGAVLIQDSRHEADREADVAQIKTQLKALSRAYDNTREQVRDLGGDPIAPSAADVLANPSEPIPDPTPVDAWKLKDAALEAVESVVPGEVTQQVDTYIRGCVASGDCVGPTGPTGQTGPPGEQGRPPTPGEVAAAVAAVCSSTLDCEVTSEEIAQAVAAYCARASEPCGKQWTEEQIYRVAEMATVDYLSGRPCYGYTLEEWKAMPPNTPMLCYMSVG